MSFVDLHALIYSLSLVFALWDVAMWLVKFIDYQQTKEAFSELFLIFIFSYYNIWIPTILP